MAAKLSYAHGAQCMFHAAPSAREGIATNPGRCAAVPTPATGPWQHATSHMLLPATEVVVQSVDCPLWARSAAGVSSSPPAPSSNSERSCDAAALESLELLTRFAKGFEVKTLHAEPCHPSLCAAALGSLELLTRFAKGFELDTRRLPSPDQAEAALASPAENSQVRLAGSAAWQGLVVQCSRHSLSTLPACPHVLMLTEACWRIPSLSWT